MSLSQELPIPVMDLKGVVYAYDTRGEYVETKDAAVKKDVLLRLAGNMIADAYEDPSFPYHTEGDQEFLDPYGPDFEQVRNGAMHMLSAILSNKYHKTYFDNLPEGNAERVIDTAITVRRDNMAQRIHSLYSAIQMHSFTKPKETDLGLWGDWDMGETDEDDLSFLDGVEEVSIDPLTLELFNFANFKEAVDFVDRYETGFIIHPQIQTVLETYAVLIKKTEEYAVMVAREKLRDHFDESKYTIEAYKERAQEKLLNYVLLTRYLNNPRYNVDKSARLARLGIGHEIVELTVPDKFKDDFSKSELLTERETVRVIEALVRHAGNWNMWHKGH